MKKIISLLLLTISVYVFSPSESFAENLDTPFITESSISIDKEQSFELNEGSTLFSPESSNDKIETLDLDWAGGTIVCKTSGNEAYCDWVIKVKGDVITYSNVEVILKRNSGFLGSYEEYDKRYFNYRLYTPSTFIEDQANFYNLPKGKYKAYMGGSFRTLSNPTPFSPTASDPANFEIK